MKTVKVNKNGCTGVRPKLLNLLHKYYISLNTCHMKRVHPKDIKLGDLPTFTVWKV